MSLKKGEFFISMDFIFFIRSRLNIKYMLRKSDILTILKTVETRFFDLIEAFFRSDNWRL